MPEEIKLNLGSSIQGIEGWINIDGDFRLVIGGNKILKRFAKRANKIIKIPLNITPTPPPGFKHINLLKCRLPFKDNTVSYCYSSHFLEHVPRWKARELLKEVYRVLRHDGMVRFVVPDLYKIAKEYVGAIDGREKSLNYWKKKWPELSTPTEKFNAYFAKFPKADVMYLGFGRKSGRLLKRMFEPDMNHQWMYDFDDLSNLLKSTGFRKITKRKFREGNVIDCDKLDGREDESIYVEAQK